MREGVYTSCKSDINPCGTVKPCINKMKIIAAILTLFSFLVDKNKCTIRIKIIILKKLKQYLCASFWGF
jgi:hypothetical protein